MVHIATGREYCVSLIHWSCCANTGWWWRWCLIVSQYLMSSNKSYLKAALYTAAFAGFTALAVKQYRKQKPDSKAVVSAAAASVDAKSAAAAPAIVPLAEGKAISAHCTAAAAAAAVVGAAHRYGSDLPVVCLSVCLFLFLFLFMLCCIISVAVNDSVSVGFCTAPPNIALIKYFGKKDAELNLPSNSSYSWNFHLDTHRTGTLVVVERGATGSDRLFLNGKSAALSKRHTKVLGLIREHAKVQGRATIYTKNNFATAAGLASSASGFAALVLALAQAFDFQSQDPKHLHWIVRYVSYRVVLT